MGSNRYGAVREILKLFEIVGWIVTGIGGILMIAGLANASLPYFPTPSDPTATDRLIAAIPGLLLIEGGLIHVVLVKVGLANIDTAEMTKELLDIARKPTPVVVHTPKTPATQQPSKPVPAAQKQSAPTKPAKEGEQVYVETYGGLPIYQRYNGHYVGDKWFAGVKQARAYIDELAKEN